MAARVLALLAGTATAALVGGPNGARAAHLQSRRAVSSMAGGSAYDFSARELGSSDT